jgi:hypothetical protein
MMKLISENPNEMPSVLLAKIGQDFHSIIEKDKKNPNQSYEI